MSQSNNNSSNNNTIMETSSYSSWTTVENNDDDCLDKEKSNDNNSDTILYSENEDDCDYEYYYEYYCDGDDDIRSTSSSTQEQPEWTKIILNPTEVSDIMKCGGSLEAPITFSPFKTTDHTNPIASPKNLRPTRKGKKMKQNISLERPITNIRDLLVQRPLPSI